MSLFTKPAIPTSQTPETPVDSDPYAALVGEGKKFKDNQALAKGKLDSDKHIERLEGELSELRQELTQRLSLEKFLDKLEQGTEQKKPDEQTPPQDNRQTITQEDIAKTVKEIISTEKDVSTRQANVDFVRSELEKAWGKDFVTKLEEVTAELGARRELEVLAERNPKAFLRLVGADQKTTTPPVNTDTVTPPRNTVNTPFGQTHSNTKNYAYFQKLRKDDPKKYFSADSQMEMHSIAEKMGDAFYA